MAGPMWDLRADNIPCPLSFLSCFLPLLSGQSVSVLFYPILSLLWEGKIVEGYCVSLATPLSRGSVACELPLL